MIRERAVTRDMRVPMSLDLARKLDVLTDAEWAELTDWLTKRIRLVADERGIEIRRVRKLGSPW